MTLEDLGYNNDLQNYAKENNLNEFVIGRVMAEHKERYVVVTPDKTYDAEVLGNLRYTAQSRRDFPAVGDWVAMMEYDEKKGIIQSIFPRKTIIERQAVGKHSEKQIIATNVDVALIVQAVDRDFSLNRFERYLTICYNSSVRPVIVLNKIDLIKEADLETIIHQVKTRLKEVEVLSVSNVSKKGYKELETVLQKGKTYCLLGSSGVGKSTLVNNLSDKEVMRTGEISESTNRGKHVTSHREMILLNNGGILIDNPGMRELGIADSTGLAQTFEIIEKAAENCRYSDCTHVNEDGCEVLRLIEEGEIDEDLYENYQKMQQEKAHYEQDVLEKRQKDKGFGKMLKNYKKDIQQLSSKHKKIE